MPSFDEVLLSEANAMRAEGLDPTEGAFTPIMPRVMDNRLPNSFVDNIYDSISVQPFWLLTKEVMDSNYPPEPDYDPLAAENIKGYEFYASYLREARSRAHADSIKRRIDTIGETKKRLEEDSGIAEGLIAEFANPINYLPLGAVRTGVGFARGAVRGAGAFAPVVLAEEGLRSQVDPTATREELLTNVATGVVLGGLIGGGIGVIGGNTGLTRVAREYDTFQRAMDGAPVPTRDVPVEAGAFVAEPTNVPTGVAPAFGLERITNRVTGYRRLISYNIRALEDLANGMVGEFDLMFNRNKVGPDGTAPLPTQRSAWLESGMWRGMAADTLKKLDAIYNEYLGGGAAPTTIANVNVPVTMQRVGQAFGMRPSDGKMTYNDFMDAIFRAHKQDGVKADDPFVGRAASVVREFFDKARDEGVKTGFLFNQRFAAGAMAKYSQRVARFQSEIEKLEAKGTLTGKERVKLELLQQSLSNAQRSVKRYEVAPVTIADAPSGIRMEIPKGERLVGASNDNVEQIDAEIVYGPTGKMRDGKPVMAFYNRDEKKIFIDRDAVEASWADKPWLDPKVPGVRPLPDDAFPNPQSWAEFVLRHEIVHTSVRPGPGMDKAAYENLVNEIALAQLRRPEGQPGGSGFFQRSGTANLANENIPGYRGPSSDPFYLPRQYDYEKIAADESGPKVLRSILTKYYKENPLPGLSVTDENVAKRVDDTIKTILGEAQTGELQVGKGSFAQFRMERSLDIPNELVADFLETDVSKLLRSYANRAGYGIELTRKFGSRDMQDAIDDTLLQAIDELDGDYGRLSKTINEMRDEITTLRDLATGDAYAANPASLSRKAVQALTGWAAITQMGGSAITALTEVAKPIMVHGIQRNLNFILGRLADPEVYKNVSEEARVLTGEGLEVALNMHAHHYTEQGGLTAPGITKIGRAFDKATQPLIGFSQGPYYTAVLLGPVTDMMKTYSGAMSSHFMLEDILKVAAGKASNKTVEKLASYGISVDAAKRMADQPIEKLTKLRVANTSAWDDPDLVRQFVGAVAGETRRTIVTAGPANKPNISQGFIGKGDSLREFALLRLPFQYMNFGFAALNKNLLSALQGREANAFAGVAAMVGMGYMVSRLKSSDAAWERMPDEEKILRAVNLSGILGIIGDVPNMIENASSGEYGLRPMLGLPPAYGYRMYDEYSSLGPLVGPGGGKIVDMYKLFVDDSTTEPEQARILRRMIPLNDAFYWKSLFTEAERGLTETLY